MPIPTDYRDIVAMLAAKTAEGNVHWRKDRYDLSVVLENAKFSIWAGNDEQSELPFVSFALHDTNGSTIDSWYVEEGESDYSKMHQLYMSAKRHAAGVPDKLREIKNLLASTREIGIKK